MNIKYFIYKYLYQTETFVSLWARARRQTLSQADSGRHVSDKGFWAQSLINTSDEKMWLYAGESAILWLKAKPLNGQKPQFLWDRWSLPIIKLMCYSKV